MTQRPAKFLTRPKKTVMTPQQNTMNGSQNLAPSLRSIMLLGISLAMYVM